MALDATWVMLGSGERRYEDVWRALAASVSRRVSTTIGFDERLAHLIEAGADMFLMPSRFEPCGLNQMYSLRYGTVPDRARHRRARRHGRRRRRGARTGTGFKFTRLHPGALVATVAPGAGRVSGPRRAGPPSSSGACGRTTPGTFRPGSMSKCIEQC